MRSKAIFIGILLLSIVIFYGSAKKDTSLVPKGPYFGQEPPGLTPKIFAPGFISTDKKELNSVFTPDGKEFYYAMQPPGSGYRMYWTKDTNNGWTNPQPVPFSSQKSDVDMCITHDGKRMYFGSTRPIKGIPPEDFKIWYVERMNGGWSEAKYLKSPVNAGKKALYPTVSLKGTMYFQAIRDDSFGSRDAAVKPTGMYLRRVLPRGTEDLTLNPKL